MSDEPSKKVEHEVSFDPVAGVVGERKTLTAYPQCLFRGQKLIAEDTGSPPGTGTRICMIKVGDRPQRPEGGGTLTLFFGPDALGNGIRWDTCQPTEAVTIEIEFLQDCTFSAKAKGQAVF